MLCVVLLCIILYRTHSRVYLSLNSKILPQLLHTPQPSRLPNRELYFTRSPRAVEKIFTQTDQTPTVVNPTPAAAVFFIEYLFFTADTFTCFTRTKRNNESDIVVNWLLELFVNPHVLYEYRNNKS